MSLVLMNITSTIIVRFMLRIYVRIIDFVSQLYCEEMILHLLLQEKRALIRASSTANNELTSSRDRICAASMTALVCGRWRVVDDENTYGGGEYAGLSSSSWVLSDNFGSAVRPFLSEFS